MSFGTPIEGETLIDISGLRIAGVTNRRELSAVEAGNIRKAIVKYLAGRVSKRSAPFEFDWILRLHQQMFGDVWDWAGKIRSRDLNLGASHFLVRGELQGLLEDLHAWPGLGITFVEQSARLHHRAVKIHPFENGNGRWARLLANIWLRRNRQPLIEWPEQTVGATSVVREEYLLALKAADHGDLAHFIELHQRFCAKPERRSQ
ncbi:MAG: mobile mystery protein B [Planctomycetia bacterium]|nr:mobile mystery protein B [Planctomycetia bacterium]